MKNKILNILLIFLIVIQPILEIIWLKNGTFLSVGSLTFPTIIRYFLFFLISVLVLLKYKELRLKRILIIYLIFIFLFIIFHTINAFDFNSMIPNNFSYSFAEEIFYILRMLIPNLLIFIVINSSFNEKQLKISILITVIILTVVYLFTNIFKISIAAYKDNLIAGNIFEWLFLDKKYPYFEIASRGIFYNVIISYLLILFLPFVFKWFVESKKISNKTLYFLLILLMGVSCFIVGTKSTTFGFLICYIGASLLYFFFTFIKKSFKFNIFNFSYIILIFVSLLLILPVAPAIVRIKGENKISYNFEVLENKKYIAYVSTTNKENLYFKITNEVLGMKYAKNVNDENTFKVLFENSDLETQKKLYEKYLDYTYKTQNITESLLINSYSYKYDPLFWKEVIENIPENARKDNRVIQELIFERIKFINNNYFDNLFGITYSRTSKVFNLEKDFVYQYYSIGVIGIVLFLLPYLLVIGISGIYMLLNYKTKFTFFNCCFILGIFVILMLAFFSGNTLENLAISIPLGILCGYMVKFVFINKEVQ